MHKILYSAARRSAVFEWVLSLLFCPSLKPYVIRFAPDFSLVQKIKVISQMDVTYKVKGKGNPRTNLWGPEGE